jgi:hypothetical protein
MKLPLGRYSIAGEHKTTTKLQGLSSELIPITDMKNWKEKVLCCDK